VVLPRYGSLGTCDPASSLPGSRFSPSVSTDRNLLQDAAFCEFGFSFDAKLLPISADRNEKQVDTAPFNVASRNFSTRGLFVVKNPYHTCLKRLIKP
jgi:hypothetical protein